MPSQSAPAAVDVSQLSVREAGLRRTAPRRRFRLPLRYALPAALVLAFAALAAWALRDMLLAARRVTIMPVVVLRGTADRAGTTLFSAAGWVEPRPRPVLVTAMADGVVDRVLVVEGDAVETGQPIATLVAADARLALDRALADRRVRAAEVKSAQAAVVAAKANLKQPFSQEALLAEAESLSARIARELSELPFELRAAESRLQLAERDHRRKLSAGDAIAGKELDRAAGELASAQHALALLQARGPQLQAEQAALARRRQALESQLRQRTDETRDASQAEAALAVAEGQLAQAEVAVKAAELAWERTTIRAPAAGRVLEVVARPGKRLSGPDDTPAHEASTVATLYDPKQLQVRADVRLEDVPRVLPDGPVRIQTAAVAGALEGKVLFAASQADIQKNTLAVKVAILNPPPVLKPDMLVQVSFLAPATTAEPPSEQLRLYVPRQLVDRNGDRTAVWVADVAAGVARRQAVRIVERREGALVEVVEGLSPASRLIVEPRDGLNDGQRIAVAGEDTSLGFEQQR